MSKNKKLLNIRNYKNRQKTLKSELELMVSNDEYRNDWVEQGSLQIDLPLYKIMCSKVTEIRPTNSMYFTYEELLQHSGLTKKNFNKRCWSWYVSIEEGDWYPCIEICGLYAIMKDKFGKYWYPIDKEWKK